MDKLVRTLVPHEMTISLERLIAYTHKVAPAKTVAVKNVPHASSSRSHPPLSWV